MIPSIRLKAYRRGQQDVEYLTLWALLRKEPRWAVGRQVRDGPESGRHSPRHGPRRRRGRRPDRLRPAPPAGPLGLAGPDRRGPLAGAPRARAEARRLPHPPPRSGAPAAGRGRGRRGGRASAPIKAPPRSTSPGSARPGRAPKVGLPHRHVSAPGGARRRHFGGQTIPDFRVRRASLSNAHKIHNNFAPDHIYDVSGWRTDAGRALTVGRTVPPSSGAFAKVPQGCGAHRVGGRELREGRSGGL